MAAVLPYAVDAVHAVMLAPLASGEPATVMISIEAARGAATGDHLVTVELLGPGGASMMEVVHAHCVNGTGSAVFTPIFDRRAPPRGLRIRDVLSGEMTEIEV